MLSSQAWWLPVTALTLCLVARAEDPLRSPRREAPPSRIPDVAMENVPPKGGPVNPASRPRPFDSEGPSSAARGV
jgi:hypothetical protein